MSSRDRSTAGNPPRDQRGTSVMVGPVSTRVGAPPGLVYQMLSAVGQGDERDGERTDVLQRNGDELVCDFWTSVRVPVAGNHLIRTRERVTLRPPNVVEFEHLDGPVRGLLEMITVDPDPDGGTLMTYVGSYATRGIIDRLGAQLLARPVIRRVVREHFDDVRQRAEARAARSRVFPSQASVSRPRYPRRS